MTFPVPVSLPGEERLKIISGSAHPELAAKVAAYLGLAPCPVTRKSFADGETYVQVLESIRGCDVFLVQPTCAPVNRHLMELLILIDACRRASAERITAVIPYYGYARADRKTVGRESITAKLVANLLSRAGVDRVLAMDLHSAQIQGYFECPLDHLYGWPVLLEYLREQHFAAPVIVSPDMGGVSRARLFAEKLGNAPLAIIDKRRAVLKEAKVMNIIGDVAGKTAILVDDIIDTGGTLYEAGRRLLAAGAEAVYACATHPVLSPPASDRLTEGPIKEVLVTDTIPVPAERRFPQLRTLSIAALLGEAIWRIHTDASISSMFD